MDSAAALPAVPAVPLVAEAAAPESVAVATVCSLYVNVAPRADQVLVNGQPATGQDALFVFEYAGGRYKVEAIAAGYTTATTTGRGKVGEVKHVALTLAPAAPAAPDAAAGDASAGTAPAPPATPAPANGKAQLIQADAALRHLRGPHLRASSASETEVHRRRASTTSCSVTPTSWRHAARCR